jgi:hypothetical protein
MRKMKVTSNEIIELSALMLNLTAHEVIDIAKGKDKIAPLAAVVIAKTLLGENGFKLFAYIVEGISDENAKKKPMPYFLKKALQKIAA